MNIYEYLRSERQPAIPASLKHLSIKLLKDNAII